MGTETVEARIDRVTDEVAVVTPWTRPDWRPVVREMVLLGWEDHQILAAVSQGGGPWTWSMVLSIADNRAWPVPERLYADRTTMEHADG